MRLFKSHPYPLSFRFSLRMLLIVSLVLVSFLSFIRVETAHACDNANAAVTDPCVAANCVKSGVGNNGTCLQYINDCTTFGGVSGGSNTAANCSNALASCFTKEIDTASCSNNGVLARVTRCNDGNVDAAGSGNCGIDNAIDENNALTGGQDFATNKGIMQARTDKISTQCQSQQGWTIQQVQTCKDNLLKANEQCNSQLGGQGAQISQSSYDSCMAGKATNPGDCGAMGGTWDAGNKKCNPPAPQAPPGSTQQNNNNNGGNGAGAPLGGFGGFGDIGKCGQARTTLIKCTQSCSTGKEADCGLPVMGQVLKFGLSALTMIVGIAAVGGLAWAAVLYAKSEDNEGNTKEAKDLIRNVVIGIVLYGFMIAIVNWLVPGINIL